MTLQSSHAQQLAIVELDPQTNGGIPAPSPIKIKLIETKPTALTNEPKYRTKPRYGVIKMGTAKENQIIVALDFGPDLAEPRFFVDSNGNGDLTDDPRVEMTLQKDLSKEGRAGKAFSAYGNVISRYDRSGEVRSIISTLTFFIKNDELYFNRAYARMGSVEIGDSKYKVALLDQRMDGNFSSYKHGESEEPILSLLIDKNRDGVFNLAHESFDCAKPFRIGSKVFEVYSINYDGTRIILKPSKKTVKGGSLETLIVGGEVIDFEATTIKGRVASLPDNYSGKLVLLDFWATWCPPCREEIPSTVAVYKQYHTAGFEILGVSLDQGDKAQVLDFLDMNAMPWPQVYDGKFLKAEIAKLYGVKSIPMSYLVDGTSGAILAMGESLRGQNLELEVKKALAKKKKK